MRKKSNKNFYVSGDNIYQPFDLISYIERVFCFDDGNVVKTRIFSIYPYKYDEDKSVMNLYGQKILNVYTKYDEELVKDGNKTHHK